MKVRKGFVSNSSSSSFVCDISGVSAEGFELSLEEARMYSCENDHTFCDEYLLKNVLIKDKRNYVESDEDLDQEEKDKVKKLNDTEFKKWYNDTILSRYDLPPVFCPLCALLNVADRELLAYLLKKKEITKEDAVKEIQKGFKNYDEFSNFLKYNHVKIEE